MSAKLIVIFFVVFELLLSFLVLFSSKRMTATKTSRTNLPSTTAGDANETITAEIIADKLIGGQIDYARTEMFIDYYVQLKTGRRPTGGKRATFDRTPLIKANGMVDVKMTRLRIISTIRRLIASCADSKRVDLTSSSDWQRFLSNERKIYRDYVIAAGSESNCTIKEWSLLMMTTTADEEEKAPGAVKYSSKKYELTIGRDILTTSQMESAAILRDFSDMMTIHEWTVTGLKMLIEVPRGTSIAALYGKFSEVTNLEQLKKALIWLRRVQSDVILSRKKPFPWLTLERPRIKLTTVQDVWIFTFVLTLPFRNVAPLPIVLLIASIVFKVVMGRFVKENRYMEPIIVKRERLLTTFKQFQGLIRNNHMYMLMDNTPKATEIRIRRISDRRVELEEIRFQSHATLMRNLHENDSNEVEILVRNYTDESGTLLTRIIENYNAIRDRKETQILRSI